MSIESLKMKLIELFKERSKIEEEISRLENLLVKELCPKGKDECEPSYCVHQITGTCPFIREWSDILERCSVSSKK